MKKINKNYKKILSIVFLILMIFQTIQPIVFASISTSGTAKWVAGQWDSEVFTTDNKTSVGMLMRRLVNYSTGDMYTTFCGEHFINSPTGKIETGTHSVPTDPLMKKACKVAYFGWYAKYGDYVLNGGIMAAAMEQRKLDYCFTQQYIWETLGQSNATFKNASIQSKYEAFKADVSQKMARMEMTPSFSSGTITVDAGTTTTLTDNNGVLKDYISFDRSANGIRITHNKGENTMKVIVDENCTVQSYMFTPADMNSWGIIKEGTENHDTTVYISFKEGVQNQLYSLNYNDPVTMSLSLKINAFGKLELAKKDNKGNYIPNTSFKLSYNSDMSNPIGTYKTGSNGKVLIDKLKKGTIYIQETAVPDHLILDTTGILLDVNK